ncbi:hypothetical protein CANARDRAFT_200819 [[Candida] arabinofermentans NRRL YB-2248]|uniref:Sm domain-containing protein n=1 Tax=[Candida] arabinofermentans NRRL YB-2248 TaxID=983967 RepID=A0A1E4SYK6_9ASCO|nr:hypothetical protein CANARDRAFT_200819 [[Candida] arabinofermentans NRRL YB-2248]
MSAGTATNTTTSDSSNLEDLYLQSYSFTTAAAIIGSVDRKVFVLLRDGNTIFGVLRTFDQFANLVIHDGIERIYLNDLKEFGESNEPQIFLIRGENVVMVGELDIDKEDDVLNDYTKIDFKLAQSKWKLQQKELVSKHSDEQKIMFKNGYIGSYLADEIPDGHVFQVEYALEAVKRGTCAVGVKGKEIVVLACERRTTLKLQDTRTTPSKINKVDNHVQLVFAGLNADARILIDKARVEAQSHKLTLEDPVTIEYLTKYVAGVQQRYTQSGGTRPFGISTLIAGFDDNDNIPKLYQTEPSGIYSSWKANAIGRSSKTVREFLEKNYDNIEDLNDDETLKLAIKALLEVVQTGSSNIEISIMKPNKVIKFLNNDEIEKIVKEIEVEKALEADKKKLKKKD